MVATLLSFLLLSLSGCQALGQVRQGSPLELRTLGRQEGLWGPFGGCSDSDWDAWEGEKIDRSCRKGGDV